MRDAMKDCRGLKFSDGSSEGNAAYAFFKGCIAEMRGDIAGWQHKYTASKVVILQCLGELFDPSRVPEVKEALDIVRLMIDIAATRDAVVQTGEPDLHNSMFKTPSSATQARHIMAFVSLPSSVGPSPFLHPTSYILPFAFHEMVD